MKKLVLTALACAAFTGCGSKDDTKANASASAVKCPTLNGKYGEGNDSIYISTRNEGGQFSYAMQENGNYVPADGQTRNSGAGSLRVSCGSNSVEFLVKRPGQADVDITLTDIGGDQIRADANGQSITLSKQVAHAEPTPVPTPVPGVCPVLNGNYASNDGNDTIFIGTKLDGATYSYRFSADQGTFLPADGVTHRIDSGDSHGTYRVGCSAGLVTFNVNIDGKAPVAVEITDLGHDDLSVKANGQTALMHKR